MKLKNPFRDLTKFELALWLCSVVVVFLSFCLSPDGSVVSLLASLVGVTALIFVAKGYVFGQVLCIFFAILYGIVSFWQQYYGEMITYLGMSAPAALAAVIAWIRNPSGNGSTVKVRKALGAKECLLTCLVTAGVTVGFYFLLRALYTANLGFSTLSVATSFLASALTFLRSPYYALAYAANDLVLIVLWVLATMRDISYLPMIFCFVMFLANDLYGFYNWQKMKRLQESMARM
ncbi:MAG: nicotinamide mononucleotide transporter [Clostridia bacterium]|nr:nicotinamide mononucleotide transporter [Clostridia bacterium]